MRYKDYSDDTSVNVVYAGSSAILLSFAHVYPELSFISFFALVPFFWQVYRVRLRGAVSLGVMLATFFVCATSVSNLIFAPQRFLLNLVALNITFIIFGVTINRTRKHLDFDPLFIALLWFPMEYILINYAGMRTIFAVSNSGSSLVIGFCSLFGILLVSLVIVLGNSLLLLLVQYVCQRILSRRELELRDNQQIYPVLKEIAFESRWYDFPNVRAPP